MKNKKIIIFSIIILSILTITLTLFTIYLLIKTPKFTFNYKNNTEVIYEQSYDIQSINNIKINTISSDIKFKPSTDNNLKVIAYGNEDSEFKIKQDDYNLNINYDIKNNFCIGICYQEDYIVIYIPNTYNNKININTTSGDISGIDLTNADIDLITTSGDIQINNINKLDALSTSGDINIRNVNEIVTDAFIETVAQKVAEKVGASSGSSDTFTLVKLKSGQTLTAKVGFEALLRLGTASCVSSGTPGLIDMTTGADLAGGKALEKNHLYLCTVDGRGIKATSDATLLVRGPHSIS